MRALDFDIDLLYKIINKQFEMIGKEITYEEIEKTGGLVKIMKSKKEVSEYWYKVFLFEDEEQYIEWKDWASDKIKKHLKVSGDDLNNEMQYLDLCYGLNYKYESEVKAPPPGMLF